MTKRFTDLPKAYQELLLKKSNTSYKKDTLVDCCDNCGYPYELSSVIQVKPNSQEILYFCRNCFSYHTNTISKT